MKELINDFANPLAASPSQPDKVYLAKQSHSIAISGHKILTLDKISFACPLHSPSLDEDEQKIEDESTGQYTKGHDVVIFAHVGQPYKHVNKFTKQVTFVYGYSINGTTITIMPQVICKCTELAQAKPATDDYDYSQDFASEQPLIAVVQEIDPRRR